MSVIGRRRPLVFFRERGMLRIGVLCIVLVLLAFGSVAPANAQAIDKEKIVAERQDLMKHQSRNWVVIRNYLEGKSTPQEATAAADDLMKTVPTVANYFPPGTASGDVSAKTRAKPEIWSEHEKFLAADKTVATQVAALDEALKSGDKAKVEVAFKALNGCNACHDTFRAPQR
jgi:cytochrome c556